MSSRNYLPLFHKGSIMFGTIGSRPSHVDGESFFVFRGSRSGRVDIDIYI